MNDCLGKYGSKGGLCTKCLVSQRCAELSEPPKKMVVTHEDGDTNAHIEIQGLHTHTMVFAGNETEKHTVGFKKVLVKWSDFPPDYKGVELSTFDDGSLYISIPRSTMLDMHLTTDKRVNPDE